MKTLRLFAVLLATCLFAGLAQAKNTMLWEMLPNESLVELAAKFYPKSATMQRAFVKKAQQLNQDTQVYANPHARYPAPTKIVIPTLKSLSVKGVGGKKYKRKKRVKKAKAASPAASQSQPAKMSAEQTQLIEKKKTLDASLAEKQENIQTLEEKATALRNKLDAIEQTKAAVAKQAEQPVPAKPKPVKPKSAPPKAVKPLTTTNPAPPPA